ncbi:MAG: HAMP domain-containing sensor histidine kinase [Thermoanaerobaculia bacterium]
MRSRLFHRIFATLLLFVLLAVVLSAVAGHVLLSDLFRAHLRPHFEDHAGAVARELPAASQPESELQAAVERVSEKWPLHLAVFGPDGRRLAFTSVDVPGPRTGAPLPDWFRAPAGHTLAVRMKDGRTLVIQPRNLPRPVGFLVAVIALACVLALASYPVARLVTRRLDVLEAGVRRLGEGDLGVRLEVSGEDELASLATSFNQTAGRLQTLVEAQRRMLAMVSHELRSPLARLRLALELLPGDPSGKRISDAVAEIHELDALVEELLVAGRLDLQPPFAPASPVDVGQILEEEAARTGAVVRLVDARPIQLRADARLVRMLVRNLLENAQRHGAGEEVECGVEVMNEPRHTVRVWVQDRGPGVSEGERERIFEPFYRRAGHRETDDGGVGLGLYLVQRIAQTYDGDAVCLARENGGSRFEVVLREQASAA